MSKYTVKLSEILKQLYIDSKYTKRQQYENQFNYEMMSANTNPIEIVEAARTKIFDFTYELFDPTHKKDLETKILYHYYNYEIGEDTYGAFKFNLMKTIKEIMPYYNKLYAAYAKEYDIFNNIDYTESAESTGSSESESNSKNTLSTEINDTQNDLYADRLRKSDTPQNDLEEVEAGRYISEYNYNNGNSSSNKKNTTASENNAKDKTTGQTTTSNEIKRYGLNFKGSRVQIFKEYLETIQNIDMQIIENLKSCFLLLL